MATIGYGQAIQKAAAAQVAASSIITGGLANIDTAPVVLSSDTTLLREVSVQSPLSNTSNILVGNVTAQNIVVNPGGVLNLPVREFAVIRVKGQGADTDITVNFVATVE